MKHLLLLFFLSISSLAFTQRDTIRVYFEHDRYEGFDVAVVDKSLNRLKIASDISILGFTDHLGTEAYNLKLSSMRAHAVRDYLISKGITIKQVGEVKANGELQAGSSGTVGVPGHRRVDIVYQYQAPKKVLDPPKRPVVEQPRTNPIEEVANETYKIDTLTKENIVLEGLSFIGGRHYPLPESMPVLEKLAKTMKQYPKLKIEIQGFICCDYEVKDGLDQDTGEPFLSANRARFVYDYLVKEGIDPDRMRYKGYGSTRPKVFPEVTEEDRQANRRVEIEILEF